MSEHELEPKAGADGIEIPAFHVRLMPLNQQITGGLQPFSPVFTQEFLSPLNVRLDEIWWPAKVALQAGEIDHRHLPTFFLAGECENGGLVGRFGFEEIKGASLPAHQAFNNLETFDELVFDDGCAGCAKRQAVCIDEAGTALFQPIMLACPILQKE